MPSILFVCTANRFRSPFAAISFAREVVKRKDDHHLTISSAGTWTVDGLPATTEAQKEADKFGLNLSMHKSRVITEKILSQADLVLVMEHNHQESITQEFPFTANKVFQLAETVNGVPYDIPDPYGTDETPDAVALEIIEMIDRGYEKIVELALKLEDNKEH
jgi:protein-tyrosine phosphatase